jgi:hypothetical protein
LVFRCSKQMTSRWSFTTWEVGKNVRKKSFRKLS